MRNTDRESLLSKDEAVKLVIKTGRVVATIARELSLTEQSFEQ